MRNAGNFFYAAYNANNNKKICSAFPCTQTTHLYNATM